MRIRTYPFATLDGYVSTPDGRPNAAAAAGIPGAGGFPFDTWTPPWDVVSELQGGRRSGSTPPGTDAMPPRT
jgi:hypothetical protein